MKRKNIFLTLIIPGPKYPGKNMDMYMQPLKEELQQAWDEGFKTSDAASKKNFKMHDVYQYSMQGPAVVCAFLWLLFSSKVPMPNMQGNSLVSLAEGGWQV